MNLKNFIQLKLIPTAAIMFFLSASIVRAQQYSTIYWMQGIPQSSYGNPALQPLPNFYFGLPGISSIYAGFLNRGFSLADVFDLNPDGSLTFNDTKLLDRLKSDNPISTNVKTDLASFGFRSGRDYFSINISNKLTTQFSYPRDFMTLLLRGNNYFLNPAKHADLSGIALNMAHYNEIGIGYSRKWTDQLTAGIRAKALFGLANINTQNTNLTLRTDPQNFALLLASNFKINKSFPVELSPLVSNDGISNNIAIDDIDPQSYATNTQNFGLAIDLGASYRINDYFTVAASMIDLGFIHWVSDVENFELSGEFQFDGIETDIFLGNNANTQNNPFEEILDTIRDIFDVTETTIDYRTSLNTKIFSSIAYHPGNAHKFGILGMGQFFYGNFYPSFTLSYNWQPIPHIGASLSYSVIKGIYNNIGAGIHINLGPLQIYSVVDNFWPALRPHTLQTTSVHLGLNIVAGYAARKDPAKPSFRWHR